jgi:ribosome modulation factor
MAIEWKTSRMVVTPDGRIGLLADINGTNGTVQFGAGGPFKPYKLASLRYATAKEVRAADLDGVGRDETMENNKPPSLGGFGKRRSYDERAALANAADDAYREGMQARRYGKLVGECPYDEQPLNIAWRNGWKKMDKLAKELGK